MLLNLSREVRFEHDTREFHVDYLFRKDTETNKESAICLVMDVSVDKSALKTHTVIKPTSTLYLSNEAIASIVVEETIACMK